MAGARMRQLRGMEIVARGDQILKIADDNYQIKSQKTTNLYTIVEEREAWRCDCPDFSKRRTPCKHVFAILFLRKLPEILKVNLGVI